MQKKIHIQHVLLSLQPGGLENGVVNVVNRLSAERFESSICCLKHAGEFSARINQGIPIHEMGWRSGNDPWLPIRLARLFRRTHPDIVHTRNAESFYYGFLGAKLAGIKCIVHSEHGRTFNDRPFRFRVQRWFSAYTQDVFAVSKQLRQDLAKHVGIPESRMQVLYNGVDLDRFGKGDRKTARQEMGVQETDLVVGSVGRLVTVKNYPLLLKSVAALGRTDVIAVLVGEGPARAELEALARSLGIEKSVRFLGHRDDVTRLLAGMDVFVLPSFSEGMSNTLLEAMASGAACVASNVGGNPELINHGIDGYLFESGDQQALMEYLRRLCDDADLRKAFGEAARARVVSEFSIQAMIARYENLYQETVSRNGRRA
jgi:sugar transferase (PEP-CTERM/EpsH1 system associated)